MQNNIKKATIIICVFLSLIINSCSKEESKSYTCSIYLNGALWSKQITTNCSSCIAPSGYTKRCEEN